jgi:hypothetical protein
VRFGLLSLACVSWHNGVQFHSFFCKWHNFTFLYGWVNSPWHMLTILSIRQLLDTSADSTVLLLCGELQ